MTAFSEEENPLLSAVANYTKLGDNLTVADRLCHWKLSVNDAQIALFSRFATPPLQNLTNDS